MHRTGVYRNEGGLFLVPLDHSVAQGPVASSVGLADIIEAIGRNGADGVVVHKGRVRFLDRLGPDLALVVHLSASTSHAPDTNHKVLVADVEQALRCGADAVSVHVNLGSNTEAAQLADLGRVAGESMVWGMPLLAMVYPRGPLIADATDPELVAHAASVAADLGADIVKTPFTGDIESMSDVVSSCPIPVITAGGEKTSSKAQLYSDIEDVMRAGAAGVAVGRNIFEPTTSPR